MPARIFTFPKRVRLRKRREFLAVQNAGERVNGRHFLALVKRGGSGRVGITVSKKVGNSVTRNRIKRLVREFIRTSGWVPDTADVVIIAKRTAAGLAGYHEVARDLEQMRGRVARC